MPGVKGMNGMWWLQSVMLAEQVERAEKRAARAERLAVQALRTGVSGEERLLRVEEVAAWIGVHEKTIYKWVERGQLPCKRVRNRLRFARSDVSRWLQAREEGV